MRLKAITFLFVLILGCLTTSSAHALYFSDNFDTYSLLSAASTNWYVPTQGVSLDPTGGFGGSKAIKFTYNGEAYYPFTHSIVDAGLDHVYVRFKVKFGSNAQGGIKFLKIFGVVADGPSYANWTWNAGDVAAVPVKLPILCYGDGSALQNDTAVAQWGNFYPTAGQWYTITTYNRYSTNGNSDGEMWMQIDGNTVMHITNVKNRNDANPRVIDKISFGDYSNRYANMTVWYDNIEISDSPFSSTGTSTANIIPAPSSLRIVN